ncbi:MAG TPA: bifunctional 3,4-dihydroxy-2-butanone-4-phosphate synthase/GTP cyclohydrolase II [Dehalococcoidia bacterium]|nr:bifunctional 3,4-dihydroxy-2-butanone-4-phosphate synthase/GTP cyclohydrolase II [Dehalococcoidia bacterium]
MAQNGRSRTSGLATIDEAIEEYRAGRFVIIVDDEARENEGDLTMAAEFVTPDAIAFMAQHGRGLICVPMTGERLDELKIPMLQVDNTSAFGTPFTVPVEARYGVTTGISAHDRAHTVRVLIDPRSKPSDISMPGHMFPLRAREGGVLVRAGHTEATVDLSRLAGLYPAAVLCEITKGTEMARLPDIKRFARRHGIKVITIRDLIAYRLRTEQLVTCVTTARLPTEYGEFRVYAYRSVIDSEEHIALAMGDITSPEPLLVRVHDQCVTGDVFGSRRCDCGEQMRKALEMIAQEGRGLFLYMRQEGRGIGLHNKLRAYALQDQGMDTVEANLALGFPADRRDYGIGMQILRDLGVRRMRLLTNSPTKRAGLEAYGLEVVQRVPLLVPPNPENEAYFRTKKEKMGHILPMIRRAPKGKGRAAAQREPAAAAQT